MQFKKVIRKIIFTANSTFQSFFRRHEMTQDFHDMQSLNVCMTHMETFGKYKGIYSGKDVAIIATGPSLNDYKPIDGVINIGVNKAFAVDKINLDYIFIQDYVAMKDHIENLVNSKFDNVKKFYGVVPVHLYGNKLRKFEQNIIPESVILRHKASKFFVYTTENPNNMNFCVDIHRSWFRDTGTIAMSAMQFALFTNPRRIYLVGCDCSSGHFDSKKDGVKATHLVKIWKAMKHFADLYYPETEIISVNPVGLKGVFKDLMQ